jgi:hypothetical protein
VQDEDRGVRCNRIDLVERRKPLFRELMLSKTADDADPLRCGRAVDLIFQHAHGVRERAYPVPAKLHVVIQTLPNDVHVAVDQPRDHAPPVQVNALSGGASEPHHLVIASDDGETAVPNCEGCRGRCLPVERGNLAVEQDDINGTFHCLPLRLVPLCAEPGCDSAKADNNRASIGLTDHHITSRSVQRSVMRVRRSSVAAVAYHARLDRSAPCSRRGLD